MNQTHRIRGKVLTVLAIAALCAQAAFAGAPLKGVGVSLGKSPGGGLATRTTDAKGNADFGVVAKGEYSLTIRPALLPPGKEHSAVQARSMARPAMQASSKLHVVIVGAAGGRIERNIEAGSSERVTPVMVSADGKQRLIVQVSAAD